MEDAVDALQRPFQSFQARDVGVEDAHPLGGERLGEVLAADLLVENGDGFSLGGEELVHDV